MWQNEQTSSWFCSYSQCFHPDALALHFWACLCVHKRQNIGRRSFWPDFIFTRSWNHPGNLCCQVWFSPLQILPLHLLCHCCLLQYLFLPPPYFNARFPGSVWYSEAHLTCTNTPLKKKKYTVRTVPVYWFTLTDHQVSLADQNMYLQVAGGGVLTLQGALVTTTALEY